MQARPICRHKRDSIKAHLSTMFAAPAGGRRIEGQPSWSIGKFIRTARRYRTIQIGGGPQIITAEDPLTPDLRDALTLIN